MSTMEVSAFYLMEGCNDCTTCEELSLNETIETPVTSTCLPVTCLDINMSCTIVEKKIPVYRICQEERKNASIWKIFTRNVILPQKVHLMETFLMLV
jgi:hypothetical protein